MDATIITSNTASQDLDSLINNLKSFLDGLPSEKNNMTNLLSSAVKHLPSYIKIVKSHIEQLSNVLELDSHNQRTLANANLAEPIVQLIKIFKQLEDGDVTAIEQLAIAAQKWQSTADSKSVSDNNLVSA